MPLAERLTWNKEEAAYPLAWTDGPVQQRFDGHASVELTVNGHPSRWNIDTGANFTIVNLNAAQRLGLDVGSAVRGTPVDVFGGHKVLRYSRNQAVDLQFVNWRNFTPLVDPDNTLSAFDGVVGLDVLHDTKATLDFHRKEVVFRALEKRAPVAPDGGAHVVPLRYIQIPGTRGYSRYLSAELTLDGRKHVCIIDTGMVTAQPFLVTPRSAKALGLTIDPKGIAIAEGLGTTFKVASALPRSCDLGFTKVEGGLFVITEAPWDAVADVSIGMQFLTHFRATIDFSSMTLALRPPPPPGAG